MSRNNDKESIEIARKFFLSLQLDGWNECVTKRVLGRGGEATVLAVKHTDGRDGAFRYLRNNNPVAINRFFREVKILADPKFQHPNIIKILDYSKDNENPWYISELGESFFRYWQSQRKRNNDNPLSLLKLAIEIIIQILDGLKILHEQGVVHRDIKPNNIIMKPDKECFPVLIDFGVAYVENEERITLIDSAVGNRRYSPDVMMNRMDEINPWLDVYQISQLLIWMVSEKPTKDWVRPLDWRWVNYNNSLSDEIVLTIRAFTALCSEEVTSPKDAAELSLLISQLIAFSDTQKQEIGIDFDQIRNGISKGKSTQSIKSVEDIKIMNSSYQLAWKVYLRLRDELEDIYAECLDEEISVEKDRDYSFEAFYEQLVNSTRTESSVPYRLTFGNQKSRKFKVRVVCHVYRPSLQPTDSAPLLPESSNIFAFAIQRHASVPQEELRNIIKWLTIERTGEWILRDEKMENPKITDVKQIGQMMRSWISQKEIWEIIQSDK